MKVSSLNPSGTATSVAQQSLHRLWRLSEGFLKGSLQVWKVRLRPPWSPVDPPRKKKEARPSLRCAKASSESHEGNELMAPPLELFPCSDFVELASLWMTQPLNLADTWMKAVMNASSHSLPALIISYSALSYQFFIIVLEVMTFCQGKKRQQTVYATFDAEPESKPACARSHSPPAVGLSQQ